MRYVMDMTNLAEGATPPTLDGNRTVAANVRAELGYANMSQGELARALDLSDMAVTRRLSDNYNAEFSASEIARMADLFGIDPGELFRTRDRRPFSPTGSGRRRSLYLLDDTVTGKILPSNDL